MDINIFGVGIIAFVLGFIGGAIWNMVSTAYDQQEEENAKNK